MSLLGWPVPAGRAPAGEGQAGAGRESPSLASAPPTTGTAQGARAPHGPSQGAAASGDGWRGPREAVALTTARPHGNVEAGARGWGRRSAAPAPGPALGGPGASCPARQGLPRPGWKRDLAGSGGATGRPARCRALGSRHLPGEVPVQPRCCSASPPRREGTPRQGRRGLQTLAERPSRRSRVRGLDELRHGDAGPGLPRAGPRGAGLPGLAEAARVVGR